MPRSIVSVRLDAQKYSAAGTPIQLNVYPQNQQLTVSIVDQGPGIGRDDLPHLFDRFYREQGERRAEGIGLGLYITRLLVESYGGRIWVEPCPRIAPWAGECEPFRLFPALYRHYSPRRREQAII